MKKYNLKTKIMCGIFAAALTASAILFAPGCALGQDITVVLNGSELTFETEPRIVDGTTLVPMRKIFEELGMTVSWNSGNNTVTAVKNGKSVVCQIGSKAVTINGETVEVTAAPVIDGGTTLVPLRVISEALGVDVSWDADTGTVTMTKEKSASDESWKENLGTIDLSSMTVSGDGVSVSGKVITITGGGDYTVSGTAEDAMIYVNSEDRVKLRLSGVALTNTTGPAIFFDNCDKGYITISKDTENFLADGSTYDEDAKGTIFSNDDLEIKGSGSLSVTANYNHGIVSDDELLIEEGTINITAVGDGIHANDAVEITGGEITITATGDGIQSEDYVKIEGGSVNVVTNGAVEDSAAEDFGGFRGGMKGMGGRGMMMNGNPPEMSDGELPQDNPPQWPYGEAPQDNPDERPDGADFQGEPPQRPDGKDFQGEPPQRPDGEAPLGNTPEVHEQGEPLQIAENNFNSAGSDDTAASEAAASSKGIKAESNLIISGGDITVSSTDHCLHSTGIIFINGGSMELSSEKKKGISAHTGLVIEDGEINITKSTEGIESKGAFCINGGSIHVTASDDGLNAGGTEGRDVGSNTDEHSLYINGGYVYVNAEGDGVDSNGVMHFNGGTVIVNGPTNSGNGALDSGGSIVVDGGTVIAVGSSGMAEYPRSENCTQPSFFYSMSANQAANTIIRIEDSNGSEILTYRSPKAFQSIVYSSALLEQGKEYSIYLGGEYSVGTDTDGILSGGVYSGGALAETFTLDSMSTSVGSASAFGGGMNRRGGMGGGTGRENAEGSMDGNPGGFGGGRGNRQ